MGSRRPRLPSHGRPFLGMKKRCLLCTAEEQVLELGGEVGACEQAMKYSLGPGSLHLIISIET